MDCYICYSYDGPGWLMVPTIPLFTAPNITDRPSMASIQTSYYSYYINITIAVGPQTVNKRHY